MFIRTVTAICLVTAVAIPVNAAQAGILKNVAKLTVVGAKQQIKLSAAVAKCYVRAATSKPYV